MQGKKGGEGATTLRVLALGDVVGKIGRQAVLNVLPGLRQEMKLDLVIAQAENLAHGIGVTRDTLEEIRAAGIDVFTGGNHIFQKQGRELLADPTARLLRPANYPEAPGTGWTTFPVGEVKVALINLQGQVFMKETVNNPFTLLETILKGLPQDVKVVLIDFHAEATSEKVAMGWQADAKSTGRQISAVWGTHTQVPTADARVLLGGTGCVTDLGMSGARDSVIGVEKEGILRTFSTGLSEQHVIPETGAAVFNACLFEIDSVTGKCLSVSRIDREVQVG